MRLLHSKTLRPKDFIGDDNIPPYAILSHTWGEEEVTYQDLSGSDYNQKLGFSKIKYCCDLAAQDGLEWAWVDTYEIDYNILYGKSNEVDAVSTNAVARSYLKPLTRCFDGTKTPAYATRISLMFPKM
jgi:hypothetical protein